MILSASGNDNIRYYILKVSAQWCPPCRAIKPYYESLSRNKSYRNVKFLSVDADVGKDIVVKYGVKSFPTFFILQPEASTNQKSLSAIPQIGASKVSKMNGDSPVKVVDSLVGADNSALLQLVNKYI